MNNEAERSNSIRTWLSLGLISLVLIFASLFVGPSNSADGARIGSCLSSSWLYAFERNTSDCDLVRQIVFDIRLPRILLAFLVGAALGVSGTSFQALLRNPLVSPDILGLSSGAAFGAALALVLPFVPLQLAAFSGGLLAVAFSYLLARTRAGVSQIALILSGIIVSGLFTALLTIVQFATDPFKLQTIVHWTMGNMHTANWSKVYSAFLPVSLGTISLLILRWRMNVIAMGDEETRAIGLNPGTEKLLVLIPATLTASSVVAVAGVIPLIALIIPHIVRLCFGPDNRLCIPASIGFGGIFLLLVDDLTRSLSSFELPIGIFTMILSVPVFVYLLKTRRLSFSLN